MNPMRILLVTGTRADFGLWLPIIREAERRADFEVSLLVTAMHLDPRFGETVREVRATARASRRRCPAPRPAIHWPRWRAHWEMRSAA